MIRCSFGITSPPSRLANNVIDRFRPDPATVAARNRNGTPALFIPVLAIVTALLSPTGST